MVGQLWNFDDGATETFASGSHAFPTDGLFVVSLTVTDANGQEAVATKVVAVGDAGGPMASDDALTANPGVYAYISVAELLANDASGVTFCGLVSSSGADENLCAQSTTTRAGGTASLSQTNTGEPVVRYLIYSLVADDSFSYSVVPAVGPSPTNQQERDQRKAEVRVSVVKAPPVAVPDYFSTAIAEPIRITRGQLLANDTAGAIFGGVQNSLHGTLAEVTDPAVQDLLFEFTPDPGFTGFATFEYLISWDGYEPFEVGQVYIEVKDAPPVADFMMIPSPTMEPCTNRSCTVNNLSTDDLGIIDSFWEWDDGTTEHEPQPRTGAWLTHVYADSGVFTITLTVTDTIGQKSSMQREVRPDTAPVAVNDTATTERDIPVVVPVLANDSDPDPEPDALHIASVAAQHPGALAQIVPLGSSWGVKFTPPDSFVGTQTFTYVATDSLGKVATGTATVNVTQWTSITDALGEQVSIPQNTSIRIGKSWLLSNDYDDGLGSGDALTIVGYDTTILMGTLVDSDPSYLTYTPPYSALGKTLFRYTITDQVGHRDTATVRIYVGRQSTAPVPTDDYFTTTRGIPRTFTIQDVVQNDYDADGDTLSVSLVSGARSYGSLLCTTPMYSCTYTPNAGYVGTERFKYVCFDMLSTQQEANINVLTLPPTSPTFDAREDLMYLPRNQQMYFSFSYLASNDYDPERDPITVSSVDPTGIQGTLTCDGGGCLFKPGFNAYSNTSFKYSATDGHGNSDTAKVVIRVGQTNSDPVPSPDSFTTPKNTPLKFSVFQLLANDYDPNNDPMTVTVTTRNLTKGVLTCSTPQYWCTYTPNAGVTGTETVFYSVSAGSFVASSFTITITP